MTMIHLGFEIGTGKPVEIPLAHTFVSGQTQLSGKTTTLRAIVERSGKRALAFVTKRGEDFEGRRIRPYLPREGDQPIHWRMVETILASALGEKKLKYERVWLIHASRGAKSLVDVQRNVERLRNKTKDVRSQDAYLLIHEYLELVLPEMRTLAADPVLDLQPGLNVMDLAMIGPQTQAMVIRAALEHVNRHESEVLTVLPEAWEFAPLGRSAPAKDGAIAMARKGAAPGVRNFLLCDSQNIAGVDVVIRQACSVWILGVQRELNELKRTIQMIPAGIKRPKPEYVATLELGQFYACWGRNAVKTYVQPTWMIPEVAQRIACREALQSGNWVMDWSLPEAAVLLRDYGPGTEAVRPKALEDNVDEEVAQQLRSENGQLRRENADLKRRLEEALDLMEKASQRADTTKRPLDRLELRDPQAVAAEPAAVKVDLASVRPRAGTKAAATLLVELGPLSTETPERLYEWLKARLVQETPKLLSVLVRQPELEVALKREVVEVDGKTLRGRLARLIADEFFDEPKQIGDVMKELSKVGFSTAPPNIANALRFLCDMGFLTRPTQKVYQAVGDMKVRIVEAA